MNTNIEPLDNWMKADEDEHLEFKEGKERYDFEELVKYCAALANEKGGKFILGVTDKKPRKVVGTKAFSTIERTKTGLLERLHFRIEIDRFDHPDGRVLVFHVPSRPDGMAIQYKGAYWMRSGEDLVPMTPDVLQRIFSETQPDFSAQICSMATIADLDKDAIEQLRQMWLRRSKNQTIEKLDSNQLLRDAELVTDDGLTYAALILLGKREALGRFLGQAEIVFEYRNRETSINYNERREFRNGFLPVLNDLWALINLRNDKHQYQDGLFSQEIPTFNEVVIREAILNAVSHRDYRLTGSVFVRQYPQKIEFISPGGFPTGISPENILWRQNPRNRRIAEVLAKCGLVERSGQGADRMFEECIRESKLPPDFTGTDDYQVSLTIHGEVRDPRFLRFLEEIGRREQASFGTADLLVLDFVHRDKKIPDTLKDRLHSLRDRGIIERIGRKHILSRRFYQFVGEKGVYTRKRGLDKETNKALLLKHIQDNGTFGCRLTELRDVLPALSRRQVQALLNELRQSDQIRVEGRTSAAKWYPPSSN